MSSFESWSKESLLTLAQGEQEYLDASIARREQRAAVERSRQEQEAQLEQQANRRLKLLVAVMALGLVERGQVIQAAGHLRVLQS